MLIDCVPVACAPLPIAIAAVLEANAALPIAIAYFSVALAGLKSVRPPMAVAPTALAMTLPPPTLVAPIAVACDCMPTETEKVEFAKEF